MKVWFEAMGNRQSDIVRLFKTATWYIWVYLLAGAPCPSLGAIVATPLVLHGPGSVLLHPDDLHGLPKREAPDRCVVTFLYGLP